MLDGALLLDFEYVKPMMPQGLDDVPQAGHVQTELLAGLSDRIFSAVAFHCDSGMAHADVERLFGLVLWVVGNHRQVPCGGFSGKLSGHLPFPKKIRIES